MDDLVQRLRLLGNFGHDNHSTAHDAADEIERLTAERDALARWKSTNAPRLDALQGLLDKYQKDAADGFEAITSLQSEREANAILTNERDALQAKIDAADPVAWMFDRAEWHEGDIRGRGWRPDISRIKPYGSWMVRDVIPLYAAPPEFAALQAKLDALMLEYCPDEMSTEQVAEWGKHQKPWRQQNG